MLSSAQVRLPIGSGSTPHRTLSTLTSHIPRPDSASSANSRRRLPTHCPRDVAPWLISRGQSSAQWAGKAKGCENDPDFQAKYAALSSKMALGMAQGQ